jgi:hypothetical protein
VGLAGKGVSRGERAHGRNDSTISAGFSEKGERSESGSADVVRKADGKGRNEDTCKGKKKDRRRGRFGRD